MANWWVNRLLIRGPRPCLAAFQKSARGDRPCLYISLPGRPKRQRLSFQRLRIAASSDRLSTPAFDPADVTVEEPKELKQGMVEVEYGFLMARYDPEPVLVEVSRIFPTLCFVLAWVDSNSDTEGSSFIHKGRRQSWALPKAMKARLQAQIRTENVGSDDEIDVACWEADSKILTALVEHWNTKSEKVLRIASRVLLKPMPGKDKTKARSNCRQRHS